MFHKYPRISGYPHPRYCHGWWWRTCQEGTPVRPEFGGDWNLVLVTASLCATNSEVLRGKNSIFQLWLWEKHFRGSFLWFPADSNFVIAKTLLLKYKGGCWWIYVCGRAGKLTHLIKHWSLDSIFFIHLVEFLIKLWGPFMFWLKKERKRSLFCKK